MPTRRQFLASTATLTAATLATASRPQKSQARQENILFISSNVYPWYTFYRREGRDFDSALDAGLADVARAGLNGFEPIANSPQQLQEMAPLLAKHGLALRSLYVNSTLHDEAQAASSIEQVLAIASAARPLGCRILVTNPSPIRWGGAEDKSDDQLRVQAAQLDHLGASLREQGMTLAYHNHDSELRSAAREFHHMLAGTNPANVKFCLDAHWVYRGSGNSQVALFDVVKLYGPRVVELHLRQSRDQVWTEAFGPGDVDYPRLAAELAKLGVRPQLTLEQSIEEATPKTIDAVEAHRQGIAYAREVFAAFKA